MKQKAKIYKGKRIVMGDKNLVTKNEIHVNDIPQEGGESSGGNSGGGGGSASSWRYFDISKLDNSMKPMVFPFIVKVPADNRITPALAIADWTKVTAFGVDDSPKLYTTTAGLASWSQGMAAEGLTPEVMAQVGIVEITEAEFYTL